MLIGNDPSLVRLTTVAVVLGQPQILVPILDDQHALDVVDGKSYQNIGTDEEGKRAMPHTDRHEVSVLSDILTTTLAVRGKRKKTIGNAYKDEPRQSSGVQRERIDTGESIRRFCRVFP